MQKFCSESHSETVTNKSFVCAAALTLPFVVIFWTVPVDLLRANWAEYERHWLLLSPYVLALTFIFLLNLRYLRSTRTLSWPLLFLPAAGLFLLIVESLYPSGITQTDTGYLFLKPSPAQAFTCFGAAIGFTIVFVRSLGTRAYLNCCAVVSLSLFVTGGILLTSQGSQSLKNSPVTPTGAPVPTSRPNVYHIMLDAYCSDALVPVLSASGMKEAFKGFTYFDNIVSNFTKTDQSVPSFLTGIPANWDHMKDWSSGFQTAGILAEAKTAGYKIWSYAPDPRFVFQSAHKQRTYESLSKFTHSSRTAQFADLWLARAFAALLPHTFAANGLGPVSLLHAERSALPLTGTLMTRELFEKAVSDEKFRRSSGEYMYAHIFLPHGEFEFDRNCTFVQSGTDSFEQTMCTTKLVADFLQLLSTLGRLDSSVIIIQSDHAEYFPRPTFKERMGELQSQSIHRNSVSGHSGFDIERRTKPLLLIKPAVAGNAELKSNSHLGQLADLPATVYSLLHLPAKAPTGLDLFSSAVQQPRSIDIYEGFLKKGADDRTFLRFGEHFLSGEINHYSYSSTGEWRELEKIHVQW